jgi:ligand-binding SRPBCC domain-containing protein
MVKGSDSDLSFPTLTPYNRVLEKLIVAQPVKKSFAFHETRSFVTVFTRAFLDHTVKKLNPVDIITRLKMLFNIFLPSARRPHKWYLPFTFPH